MSKSLRSRFIGWARPVACPFLLLTGFALTTACAGRHSVVLHDTAELGADRRAPVTWFGPVEIRDTQRIARWRQAVGPPVVLPGPSAARTPVDEITLVSWNMANGHGDLDELLRSLPSGRPLVLLLQEAFRRGTAVPTPMPAGAFFAGRLGGVRSPEDARDVEALAAAFGLHAYYVPSMRNGGPTSDEDRGNAILSTLPLTDLAAIELPFERQRRVVAAATIEGVSVAGAPWRLRVASVHFDGFAGAHYGWLGGELGRRRQARALRDAMTAVHDPLVIGGDFNTWFGFTEPAYVETRAAFPDGAVTDLRPTFGALLRLDHFFFRLDDAWDVEFGRSDSRFGSDHFPLVGTLRLR